MNFEQTHSSSLQARSREAREENMCGRKHRYPDKRAAQTFLNSYGKNRGRHDRPEWLRAYPCPICKGWHLTKGKPK